MPAEQVPADPVSARPVTPSPRGPAVHRYGDAPSQYAELTLPSGTHRGTAVVIHGGYWRTEYDAGLGRPLAADLAARGWAAWNLEYRRTGGPGDDRGGWPETFEDVAAGLDLIPGAFAGLGLDPGPVVLIGHSAGGHLAVWAAGRHVLPAGSPGAEPLLRPAGVVSQSGVLCLHDAAARQLSDGAARILLGADPDEEPARWRGADPLAMLPIGVPVAVMHADADLDVPSAQGIRYAEAARAAGDPVRFHWTPGDHYALINPESTAWAACVAAAEAFAPVY
ncbi:alpha/beta hydrolase [Zafaria sp. Z1313]|uniref:alpha/beta hydrolase n=1 Tax=Zafaria sp. Z1313 TaxID=3423202 RepID=UPI003D30180C